MKLPGVFQSYLLSLLAIFSGLCLLAVDRRGLAVALLAGGGLLALINSASAFRTWPTRAQVIAGYIVAFSQILLIFLGDSSVFFDSSGLFLSSSGRVVLEVLFVLTPITLGIGGFFMTRKWWFTPALQVAVSPLILSWLFFRDYGRTPNPGTIQWFLPQGLINLVIPTFILACEIILMSLSAGITSWICERRSRK